MGRFDQCPFERVRRGGGTPLCCARERGHDGPHLDVYEKGWRWVHGDARLNECPFAARFHGLPYLQCGRERGHDGPHCTSSQLGADWHLPGAC